MQWHGRSLEHCYVTVLRTPMEKPCPVPEWRTDMSATAFLALVDAWLTLDHASKQVQRYFSLKHVARASNDQ